MVWQSARGLGRGGASERDERRESWEKAWAGIAGYIALRASSFPSALGIVLNGEQDHIEVVANPRFSSLSRTAIGRPVLTALTPTVLLSVDHAPLLLITLPILDHGRYLSPTGPFSAHLLPSPTPTVPLVHLLDTEHFRDKCFHALHQTSCHTKTQGRQGGVRQGAHRTHPGNHNLLRGQDEGERLYSRYSLRDNQRRRLGQGKQTPCPRQLGTSEYHSPATTRT
jgi:hypothetical protein